MKFFRCLFLAMMVVAVSSSPQISVAAPVALPADLAEAKLEILTGHSGPVKSLAFSADGLFFASAGEDNSVKIWSAPEGILKHILSPEFATYSLKFSADNRTLAAADKTGLVMVWDVPTGVLLYTHRQTELGRGWRLLNFSPDASVLAVLASSNLNKITILDARSGEVRRTFTNDTMKMDWIVAAAFSPDGETMYLANREGVVREIDSLSGEVVRAITEEKTTLVRTIFSPDGKRFARFVKTRDEAAKSEVEIHDMDNGALEFIQKFPSMTDMVFSSDSRTLLVLSDKVQWLDLETRIIIKERIGGGATFVASPDEGLLVISDDNFTGELTIDNTQTERKIILPGNSERAIHTVFSPDSQTLAVADYSGRVSLWDLKSGKRRLSWKACIHFFSTMAWSSDGKILATDDVRTGVQLRDTQSGALLQTIPDKDPPTRIAWSPDGKMLAGTSSRIGNNVVRIWNAQTKEILQTVSTQSAVLQTMAFSVDSKTLICIDSSSGLKLWDIETGRERFSLTSFGWPVRGALAPSGQVLTVVSQSMEAPRPTVVLLDLETAKVREELPKVPTDWTQIDFFPDGNTLALIDDENENYTKVRLWSMPKNSVVHSFDLPVSRPVFSRSRKQIAASDQNGATHIWDEAGQLRLTLQALPETNQWISYTPEGFYVASDDAAKFIRWRIGANVFPSGGSFEKAFHQPDKIAEVLKTDTEDKR